MNKLVFIASILLCSIVLADDMSTDPCPNDTIGYCMNKKAIEYVNDLRSQQGRSALGSGSMYMFDNAMDHSKEQDRRKDIFHQPIGSGVSVGQGQCRVTLSGENVAFYGDTRIKNAAMYCVMDLWKNSPGHYNNMMTASHKNTVIAIYRANGRVTCTQTFSGKPLAGTGRCAAALPANRGNTPAEQPLQPKKDGEAPAAEEAPVTNGAPVMPIETAVINEDPVTQETPTTTTEDPMTQETPMAEETPMMEKTPMVNDAQMTEDAPMTKETPIHKTPTMSNEEQMMREPPMNKGKKMRMKGMRKMRMGSMKEKYIIMKINGRRVKFVKRNFNGRHYICNPKTKRCFGRRASKKILRVLKYLSQ